MLAPRCAPPASSWNERRTGHASTPTGSTPASVVSSRSRSPRSRRRSCSCVCCEAMPAEWGSRIRTRSFARRCCCVRMLWRRAIRARGSRRSSCCSNACAAACCLTSRAAVQSVRAGTSRRSRILRCHWSAKAMPGTTATCSQERMPFRRQVSNQRGSRRRKDFRSSTARSSWRRSGHSA